MSFVIAGAAVGIGTGVTKLVIGANQKRKAYRARHKCGTASKYSASNLACEILWWIIFKKKLI